MNAQIISRFSVVKPYLTAVVAFAAAVSLIAINYFMTGLEPQVINLMWIVLIAALVAMILQITKAEKALAKHEALFVTNEERLSNEIKYRLCAEKTSSENKTRLQIVDENFPVMLAYFNTNQQCLYHNRAYRLWFGLKAEQIDNRFTREFLTAQFHQDLKNSLDKILAGEIVQNKHIQKLTNGSTCLILEQFVPRFDTKGKVIGFYTLYTPRIMGKNEVIPDVVTERSQSANRVTTTNDIQYGSDQGKHENKLASSAPIDSAERVIQAIDQGKFNLYCQNIISTKPDANAPPCYKILIRMTEEEANFLPPGAFLSFVEKYNLMPRLDRWIVSNLTNWLATHKPSSDIIFFINLAKDTMRDNQFIGFLETQLRESNIPAKALCFEIEESDAKSNHEETAIFAQKIRHTGCRVSLSSFNHDQISFKLLKNIKIDFLKIDGGLICNLLNDATCVAKLDEINRIAHLMKIQTIAESVESKEIIEKLNELSIDFAQGFDIAPAEKTLAKHEVLLSANKDKLPGEIKYPLSVEKISSEKKTRSQIVSKNFPVMLAYFNTDQQCLYHNQAYRQWFGLNAEQIDNRFTREFLTEHFYQGLEDSIDSVLDGEIVQNKCMQKLTNGSTCLILEQFVPHFDTNGNGKVIGFHTLYTPRVLRENEKISENSKARGGNINHGIGKKRNKSKLSSITPLDSAESIIQAIERGKFRLYCQKIIATKPDSDTPPSYEILIRMVEEDNNLLPPGAFLSFVEKYKLMPRLDRWIVSNLTKWIATHKPSSNIIFFINLAKDTMCDDQFIDFVAEQIRESAIPAQVLCFEIEESDAKSHNEEAAIFARKIRQIGCKISLSSFKHDRTSFKLIKDIKIDYLKIDGSLISNILSDPTCATKLGEINRIAHLMKIQTIAEFVESTEIIEKLSELKINLAQGFGIATPQSIQDLE